MRKTPVILVMQRGSNLTASAISRAIRADRQARGEIGSDQVEVDAMDYTGAHRMKVAPGDELRVFNRIQAGRQVIANNSDVIVVQKADVVIRLRSLTPDRLPTVTLADREFPK